jgi:hypothetical protein
MARTEAIDFDGEIVVKKFDWVFVVGYNATDPSCCHHNYVRPGGQEVFFSRLLAPKIEVTTRRNQHLAGFLSQSASNGRTRHAVMASYKDAFAN